MHFDNLRIYIVADLAVSPQAVEEAKDAIGVKESGHIVRKELFELAVVLAKRVEVDSVVHPPLSQQLRTDLLPLPLVHPVRARLRTAGLPLGSELRVRRRYPLQYLGVGLDDVVLRGLGVGEHGIDDSHAEADVEYPLPLLGLWKQGVLALLHDIRLPSHHDAISVLIDQLAVIQDQV